MSYVSQSNSFINRPAALLQAIADGVVGDPISAILQSRDPSPPPFSYVKGGGGLFKVKEGKGRRIVIIWTARAN